MIDFLPSQPVRGRGAASNPKSRFEHQEAGSIDDGWHHELMTEDEPFPAIPTNLHIDHSRSVINEIKSPDLPYERSINPYRGCEHGCVYCYARPSHSFLGYSAGLDFETEIFYKPETPKILTQELSAKSYSAKPITLGSNTDCYQPIERKLQLTRQILEILAACHHPVNIITKSALVLRDLDLISPMANLGLASVGVSITTLDTQLARQLEPRATIPAKRLASIEALARLGIPVTVMVAPVIPGLNDHEIENILKEAFNAGARKARYLLLRLPYELKDLFTEWLQFHRANAKDRVLSLLRQTRGGKLNNSEFFERFEGNGVYADLIAQRFKLALRNTGYEESRTELRTDLFCKPTQKRQIAFNF